MAESPGLVIAVGILSFLVLGCGVSFSALTGYLQHELHSLNPSYSRTYWYIGFAYMLSGIIGLTTCCSRTRGAYTAHMVIGIIVLIIKALVVIGAFLSMDILNLLKLDDTCIDVSGQCHCASREYIVSCGEVNSLYAALVGVCAVIIIGWFLTLFNTIAAGLLRSRCQTVVLPVVPMNSVHNMAPPAYSPPTYDRANLVGNMEYQPGMYPK